MTRSEAIYQFFNRLVPYKDGFVEFYPATGVPSDVQFPYGTYENIAGDLNEVNTMTVNLYFYTSSEKTADDAAEVVFNALSSGVVLRFDGGYIWLTRGTPFSQGVPNEETNIKQRYILLNRNDFTN